MPVCDTTCSTESVLCTVTLPFSVIVTSKGIVNTSTVVMPSIVV